MVVEARAAEAVKAKTAKHAIAMLNFRIIDLLPYPIGVVPIGWCAPSSDVCPRLRNQNLPLPFARRSVTPPFALGRATESS